MGFLNQDMIIEEFPLFANLSQQELNFIQEKLNIVEYKKDQIIYEEGSPADAFYGVVLGRVVIYTADANGNETILEYLHRGKYFGIISLLTDEPHSVTAKAVNDCLILIIKKENFDSILKKIPQLAIDLSQTLSRRLKNKDFHQKTIFESTIISIFSSYSPAGKSIYALNLAFSLKKETHKTVIILDICSQNNLHSLPQRLEVNDNYCILDLSLPGIDFKKTVKDFILSDRFGIDLVCLDYKPDDESCIERLVGILSFLLNDYHYIMLDLPSFMDPFILRALNQSDTINILTSPEPVDLKKTQRLIRRLKTEFNFSEVKIKVIINEYKLAVITFQQQMELLNHPIFATLPKIELGSSDRIVLDKPNCEYALAVRRISRQLGDCLVGLVLGVGVAYGFCHIGVLKAIEEERIPIDIISGSSIGALIASLWAIGLTSQEILKIVKTEFKEPKSVWGFVDLTFPSLGFIKGNKLYNLLKKYLGNKTFYDIKLPLKIIASDIRRKESKVLDKGLLVDAIMASSTMPGVFRPFSFKEEILFDGGIINPLPTEALFKLGVKKIIAVNVTPSREDMLRQYQRVKEQINTAYSYTEKKRSWFSLRHYIQKKHRTNILDIIFSSIEVMQSEIAQQEAKFADIVLHPNTQGLHWLELHRGEEFAQRGEEETRKNLEKIWNLINE